MGFVPVKCIAPSVMRSCLRVSLAGRKITSTTGVGICLIELRKLALGRERYPAEKKDVSWFESFLQCLICCFFDSEFKSLDRKGCTQWSKHIFILFSNYIIIIYQAAKSAWQELGQADPAERTGIVSKLRSGEIKTSEVPTIVLEVNRVRQIRKQDMLEQMDELSFKAHYKYIRGWNKSAIKLKWQDIITNPQNYQTTLQPDGSRLVWVPLNKRLSLEDVTETKVKEAQKLPCDPTMRQHLLFGKNGGVMPSNAAVAQGLSFEPLNMLHMPLTESGLASVGKASTMDSSDSESESEAAAKPERIRTKASSNSGHSDTIVASPPSSAGKDKKRKAADTENDIATPQTKKTKGDEFDSVETIAKPLQLEAFKEHISLSIAEKIAGLQVVQIGLCPTMTMTMTYHLKPLQMAAFKEHISLSMILYTDGV